MGSSLLTTICLTGRGRRPLPHGLIYCCLRDIDLGEFLFVANELLRLPTKFLILPSRIDWVVNV
jgi:hypothetical protein